MKLLPRTTTTRIGAAVTVWLVSIGVFIVADIASTPMRLVGEDFENGWMERWTEKKLADRPNVWKAEQDSTGVVLRGQSYDSASMLVCKAEFKGLSGGELSWRWKVDGSLRANDNEREKGGDDYAARVLVFFETSLFRWRTRTISYVWAANEPEGAMYRNPFQGNTVTIVVRSGDGAAGEWLMESRQIVADYERYFGRPPKKVSGMAILVDTDNTGDRATAWFDDVVLECW